MNHRFKILKVTIVLLLSASIPNLSQASGFALIEMSASGQGNAFAGAAAHANDASTVFFNPAGMMKLEHDQLSMAGHFISPSASFTNNGSSMSATYATASTPPLAADYPTLRGGNDDGGSPAIVPNLYWVTSINESTKFGLGVNSPFGLATEYDKGWVGRYHGVLSDLKVINFNPSLAYRINDRVSIGGGLDIMLGTVELSSAIDMGSVCVAGLTPGLGQDGAIGACTASGGAAPQELDGFADLTGNNLDNVSAGFNLGLTFEASSNTTLGVSYRSEVEMKVKGDADFTVPTGVSGALDAVIGGSGGLFDDTGLNATVNLPASLALSVAHRAGKFTYLADITWTGWSSFEELRIIYDNPVQPDTVTTEAWEDTLRYSLGVDYQYADDWILRAGIALDETPVPDAEHRTPRLPGNDRTWLSLGFTYMINQKFSVDVGYSHLFIDDAKTNNTLETTTPELNATLTGTYEADVDILSAQLNWNFI